jgi:TPR repeat protein
MFEVLNNCFESLERPSHKPSKSASSNSENSQNQDFAPAANRDETIIPTDLPDFDSFNYMTLDEATKQHRKVDKSGRIAGDIATAYKCFEAYVKNNTTSRNQIIAKYYMAYYISRELVEGPKEKDKIAAELFKEVADNEASEIPEAKLRYGDCLYSGKGVEKNLKEALKYFEQAAGYGFRVAMYNAGKLYYNGEGGITKNDEKAIEYMKSAIYREFEGAIKFCKEHNIAL